MRYELPTVPYSLNGYTRILNATDTALIPASSATTPATFKPTPGFKFIDPTHNDWAPRLGFAYRLAETTVVRGGFGIYWNANQLNTYTLTTQNYPLSASVAYNGQATNLLTLANPTPGAGAGSPMAGIPGTYVNAVTMGPHLPTQELYQWNLSWGQELWKGAAPSCNISDRMRSIWTAISITTRPSPVVLLEISIAADQTSSSAESALSRMTNIPTTTALLPFFASVRPMDYPARQATPGRMIWTSQITRTMAARP